MQFVVGFCDGVVGGHDFKATSLSFNAFLLSAAIAAISLKIYILLSIT